MRQNNPRNTKDRDQALVQKAKKTGKRKKNHRKNKVTTKQKNACLKHRKHNHQLRIRNTSQTKQTHTKRPC